VSDGPEVALNWPFTDLNFFDSAQCLMVRRWCLIGHFLILFNPPLQAVAQRTGAGARRQLLKGAGEAEEEPEEVRFCRYRFPASGLNSKATWFGIQ
jgi:hypothetical protein